MGILLAHGLAGISSSMSPSQCLWLLLCCRWCGGEFPRRRFALLSGGFLGRVVGRGGYRGQLLQLPDLLLMFALTAKLRDVARQGSHRHIPHDVIHQTEDRLLVYRVPAALGLELSPCRTDFLMHVFLTC